MSKFIDSIFGALSSFAYQDRQSKADKVKNMPVTALFLNRAIEAAVYADVARPFVTLLIRIYQEDSPIRMGHVLWINSIVEGTKLGEINLANIEIPNFAFSKYQYQLNTSELETQSNEIAQLMLQLIDDMKKGD